MVYIDQNAARNPSFPLEPLFRALYFDKPDFQIGDVDMVSDRNNIRKLLRFVQGSDRKPFEIRVEIAGERTALFRRRVEAKATEVIRGFRRYGHSFEDAYTKKESGNSSRHRIVGYDFGGMKCIIRHETDGYIQEDGLEAPSKDLSDAFKQLSLTSPASVVADSKPAGVTVQAGGQAVEMSSTLEIKTRVAHRKLDMTEVSSQLWISQTPKLVIAYHQNGIFNNIQVRDMTDELCAWEKAKERDLCRLNWLLKKIIEVVKNSADRKAVVVYKGGVTLKIVSGTGQRALPDDLYARWEKSEQQEGQAAQVVGGDVKALDEKQEEEMEAPERQLNKRDHHGGKENVASEVVDTSQKEEGGKDVGLHRSARLQK
jgi:hypothetical protein